MIRLTKGVFYDLAIWMMGFGMLVGVVFPFFMDFLGMDPSTVYTLWFFSVCIFSGLLVGAVNILLARWIVGGRLNMLSAHMGKIEDKLHNDQRQRLLVTVPPGTATSSDSTDAIGRLGILQQPGRYAFLIPSIGDADSLLHPDAHDPPGGGSALPERPFKSA